MSQNFRLALLVCCLMASPTAKADDPHPCSDLNKAAFDNYETLEMQGVEAFKANDYDGAIKRFETAKALCAESQPLIFALGRSYQLAGNCTRAIEVYKQALQLKGPKLDSITQRLTEAESECSQKPPSEPASALAVSCEQPHVSISINNAPFVACPVTQALPVGPANVRAEKPNHTPHEANVQIRAGETTTLIIQSLAEIPPIKPPVDPRPPVDLGPSPSFIGQWLIAGGAITIAGGLGLYVWADVMRTDVLDAKSSADANNLVQTDLTRQEALDLESDANIAAGFGWGLMGLGFAACLTGAVFVYMPDQAFAVTPRIDNDLLGVSLGGHF